MDIIIFAFSMQLFKKFRTFKEILFSVPTVYSQTEDLVEIGFNHCKLSILNDTQTQTWIGNKSKNFTVTVNASLRGDDTPSLLMANGLGCAPL